ncbi:MAG TPA: hypothetical protein V6D20_00195, partial [Candidatus Obscuribacterales bacterium]
VWSKESEEGKELEDLYSKAALVNEAKLMLEYLYAAPSHLRNRMPDITWTVFRLPPDVNANQLQRFVVFLETSKQNALVFEQGSKTALLSLYKRHKVAKANDLAVETYNTLLLQTPLKDVKVQDLRLLLIAQMSFALSEPLTRIAWQDEFPIEKWDWPVPNSERRQSICLIPNGEACPDGLRYTLLLGIDGTLERQQADGPLFPKAPGAGFMEKRNGSYDRDVAKYLVGHLFNTEPFSHLGLRLARRTGCKERLLGFVFYAWPTPPLMMHYAKTVHLHALATEFHDYLPGLIPVILELLEVHRIDPLVVQVLLM